MVAFILCYVSYTCLHISRTSWSFVAARVEEEWVDETVRQKLSIMGTINFLFMAGYASGLLINGNLGDKLNPKYFYPFGLIMTAAMYLALWFMGEDSLTKPLYF